MISWWQHLSWSHATIAVLLPALAVGYVLTDSVEDPRAWRFLRAVGRFRRRRPWSFRHYSAVGPDSEGEIPEEATALCGAPIGELPLTTTWQYVTCPECSRLMTIRAEIAHRYTQSEAV